MLSQMAEDGSDQPVVYFSRKLLTREKKYSTVEKECLAIKLAVQAFRVYLLGSPFIIQTEHRALEWLDRVKKNNGRLTRWSLFLQPYMRALDYYTNPQNLFVNTVYPAILTVINKVQIKYQRNFNSTFLTHHCA